MLQELPSSSTLTQFTHLDGAGDIGELPERQRRCPQVLTSTTGPVSRLSGQPVATHFVRRRSRGSTVNGWTRPG